MREDFNNEATSNGAYFDSEAIQVNLNGPITSIDAVVNNTPRADGKTEWEHLLGKPVNFTLTVDQIKTANDEIKEKTASLSKDSEDYYEQYISITNNTFKEHLPELAKSIENSFEKNWGFLKEDSPDEYYEGLSDYNNQRILKILITEQACAHKISDDLNALVLPSYKTPREAAAGYMGIENQDELPDYIPGDYDTWRAATIIHELEHMTDQNFQKLENAPDNIVEYRPTLCEIDSDNSFRVLLRPHVTDEFLTYRNNARIIGTINNLTRSTDNELQFLGTSLQHAVGLPLENLDEIRNGEYSVSGHLDDLESLKTKLREQLDYYDNNYQITQEELSLRDIATAMKELICEDNIAREIISDNNSVETVLTDEEREICAEFLEALDEVGFTQKWENEQTMQIAENNADQALDTPAKSSNNPMQR